jgi:vanillate O-demethylase monooxygenase subunit
MTANYPKKCWYVAATSEELGDAPLGRRLLGHDVVLWRSSDRQVTALDGRCAHRGFPLSDGHVDDDRLVCGYHGCTYGADGKCVHVPTQPYVPTGMGVAAFPVVEKPPYIWIWLGPPAAAAASRPPPTPWLADPEWSTFSQAWQVAANYLMVHEHYLDFSYAPVLHSGDLPPGMDRLPPAADVEVSETSVSYTRELPEAPLAPWEAESTELDADRSYARQERGTFVSPAMHVQRWQLRADGQWYIHERIHAITPETDTSTHVFMQVSRNYRPPSDAADKAFRAFIDGLVARDVGVLEMIAARGGYDSWQSGVEFVADAAVLRARRIVRVMLGKEGVRLRSGQPRVKPPAAG